MAIGYLYICDNCGRRIEAWDDGNPYYFDKAGKKKYAHHPDHENLKKCIGNDTPHICLDCGKQFKIDSLNPVTKCPKCKSGKIESLWKIGERRCPYCKEGVFHPDLNYFMIS